MNGFVSIPPPPSGDEPPVIINADGFFDAVALGDVRNRMRVDTGVSDTRLRAAVLAGMTSAMRELAAWRQAQVLAGYATAADVPCPAIDGVSSITYAWLRAVDNFAMAELAEQFRDVSATGDGSARAEEKALTADDYRRNAFQAVRDIIGEPRITAELI